VIRVVIGAAEQSIAYDLRAALTEMEGVDALFVVESTAELITAVMRLDPDLVLVHDQLGPEPVLQVVRDLALRKPACAALLVSLAPNAAQLTAAMDAGARGMVSYPLTLEELQSRIGAAGDWAQQMRRVIGAGLNSHEGPAKDRARVVTFVGAKGGTGTTTIATHMALDVAITVAGYRVCLVDLDLEKGDLSGILEVRHRASIAEVAKVSADLSAQAVADAVVVHETGVHLLLAPAELRDVEAVTPQAMREVLSVLRSTYDLVVIDAGSHVTPIQATVVELADEVVAVTTPDVLAMRGLRRAIGQWESLGVRKETDVRVLVNRVSKGSTVSLETVQQLTRAPVVSAGLPAMFRRLEPAVNARDPQQLRDDVWWRTLRAIGRELGLVRVNSTGQAAAALTGTRAGGPGKRGRTMRRKRQKHTGSAPDPDSGAVALETVGVLPVLLFVLLLMWQAGIYGMSMVWSGRAASAAARAASVHQDPAAAARRSVPASVASGVSVSSDPASTQVVVTLRVPLAGGLGPLPESVTTRRSVVSEP
jgi:pilus assembly protein CpaE